MIYHLMGLDCTLMDHRPWAGLTTTHFQSLNYLPWHHIPIDTLGSRCGLRYIPFVVTMPRVITCGTMYSFRIHRE